ncbi:uncharacterized protein GGS25DRAFT_520011 [Hypoxylon fragiforme]|uniref:uncharacterized protein n=1 Tax=Hypoxylon fragiforme TaxID=63214 RepID=UPI0020C69BDD|nr:uncharacterized protein GGS25DRAFT_520011 [Hypoxylon fragiforme]KAI2611700.1 hypothetical protein GGS25DRAFT_520011 [Hypoxylon fragiforme]
MSPFVPTPKPKYISDDDEATAITYLGAKEDKFESGLPVVVNIDSDPSSSDGQTTPTSTRGISPRPPLVRRSYDGSRFRGWWKSTWKKNKAPLLMFAAQLFGALMNLTARILEVEEGGMHPMRLLFVRQAMTALGASFYILWKRIPHGLLGHKDVRWLLLLRAFCGFFGIYGMWYSVKYIPLAEATVITFLSPNIAGYMCHLLIHDPFTRTEQLGSLVALGGVVLITRPLSLLPGLSSTPTPSDSLEMEAVMNATTAATSFPEGEDGVTSIERLVAIGFALLGVFGGAGAITSLRWIGKRAHPLVSINYFSTWCVVVSMVVLSLAPVLDYGQPEMRLELPHSIRQWVLLVVIVACGLTMQTLMTAALATEKSNRATAMIYTHMLFAAAFDRWVFGHIMGWTSVTGCGLIVGSALWVALTRQAKEKGTGIEDNGDAERGMMANVPGTTGSERVPILIDDLDSDIDIEEEDGVSLRRL